MLGNEAQVARELAGKLEKELNRVGLLFRIFYRTKSETSIVKKISQKKYTQEGKKLQDFIGIRVALYFSDDIPLCQDIANTLFQPVAETIDQLSTIQFMPVRYNLVYLIPDEFTQGISVLHRGLPIDQTFELQIRTMLSEGWHEIEHDLRYKCQADWIMDEGLSRILNGTMATLENCDWSILQVFDRLSYQHYRRRNWDAMIRHKLRMRLGEPELDDTIKLFFDNNNNIAKELFRVNRNELLRRIQRSKARIPLTPGNIVHIMNHLFIKSSQISAMANEILKEELELFEQIVNDTNTLKVSAVTPVRHPTNPH